jgi:putative membrane protein insertion efficiency factor
MARMRRAAWLLGWPARATLLALIGSYRLTLGRAMGGRCRFYPSCSAYAEAAVREVGAFRGTAFTLWRILRCSPLSAGGVDHPPRAGRPVAYEAVIHTRSERPMSATGGAG